MMNTVPANDDTEVSSSAVITLAIVCALVSLVLYRQYCGALNTEIRPKTRPEAVIEVSVHGKMHGVYFFSTPPTLEDVFHEVSEFSGVKRGLEKDCAADYRGIVENGTKVTLTSVNHRQSISFGPMSAEKRLAFGIPIDLNAASAEDLSLISGIGPGLAQKIVSYRLGIGGFRRCGELRNVKGIGQKRFESIRKYVTVNSEQ